MYGPIETRFIASLQSGIALVKEFIIDMQQTRDGERLFRDIIVVRFDQRIVHIIGYVSDTERVDAVRDLEPFDTHPSAIDIETAVVGGHDGRQR